MATTLRQHDTTACGYPPRLIRAHSTICGSQNSPSRTCNANHRSMRHLKTIRVSANDSTDSLLSALRSERALQDNLAKSAGIAWRPTEGKGSAAVTTPDAPTDHIYHVYKCKVPNTRFEPVQVREHEDKVHICGKNELNIAYISMKLRRKVAKMLRRCCR